MRLDRLEEIGGPSVMQEEDPLPNSPQRRRAEFVPNRRALKDVIRQARSHVVHEQIGEQICCLVA